ncbi:MAG: S8 family peptidase [Salibacteraceae bacterium]
MLPALLFGQYGLRNSGNKEGNQDLLHWHNLDYSTNKVYGASVNKCYAELIGDEKPKKKIVVAIIDSGVETDHVDLSGSIWTNTDEIAGNNKDDDNNGYVDDVHGWNFVVDEQNNDVQYDNFEATRILRLSKKLKEAEAAYPEWLTNDIILRSIEIYNQNVEEYKSMAQFGQFFTTFDSALTSLTGKENYSVDDVLAINTEDEDFEPIKDIFKAFKKVGIEVDDLREMASTSEKFANYYLNYDFDPRPGHEPGADGYGNNHYEGPDATHGTHVAGIVACNRNNDIGAIGISSEVVEIMAVRAVPDGDERDTDVANAIRYAVDNGANIINMSFGKGVSPFKPLVDDAIAYAMEHNVLIVHGAGNDAENIDLVTNYPNPYLFDNGRAQNYITVGSITSSTKKDMVSSFSNYGKLTVDIFAPGSNIFSAVPDNGFKKLSGTSMAAPVVSGVAALIWAYHPELTAVEVKQILMESATKPKRKKVLKPGGAEGKEKIRFSDLSSSGGIVNAYEAFKLADIKSSN